MFSIITCAWWSYDDATIFMALVIFLVLLTLAMRFFISFKLGMNNCLLSIINYLY